MAITRERKTEVLGELKESFANAKSVFFSGYRGLTVKQISDLRSKLREENVEMKVAKKTLMRLAAKEAGYTDIPDEALEGPVAAIFCYEDEVAGAKIVHQQGKELEALTLIGGLMEGNALSTAEAKQIALIPSRPELLAKLVGSMKAPISGFHGVLHGTMRQFVGTLAAYKDKKEQEA